MYRTIHRGIGAAVCHDVNHCDEVSSWCCGDDAVTMATITSSNRLATRGDVDRIPAAWKSLNVLANPECSVLYFLSYNTFTDDAYNVAEDETPDAKL